MTTKNSWIAVLIALFSLLALNTYSDVASEPRKSGLIHSDPVNQKPLGLKQQFDSQTRQQQRKDFLLAEKAISKGQLSSARKIMLSLGDYPLVSYLELEIMLRDLYRVPAKDVEAFIEKHKNTWSGEKARLNWLNVLSHRKKHTDYIRHFQHVEPTTATRCQYLKALIGVGKSDEAYKQTPDLWLTGTSQPDACNALFSSWKKSSHFDEEFIWQRFLLARKARQYGLARYLTTLAKNPVIKKRIKTYNRVRNNPALVANKNNFDLSQDGTSQLIEYGIRRLASKDVEKASNAFDQYMALNILDLVEQQTIIESLMKGWTKNDDLDKAIAIAKKYPESIREQQLDWQLQQSLKKLDWSSVLLWSEFLDDESKSTDKWQYWIARAKSQSGETASSIFMNLSAKRSYYGHLASLITEQPFHLKDTYSDSDEEAVNRLITNAGVQQALELDRINYYLNSRNAWNVVLKTLSEKEHIVAGQVAHELDLHYSGIVSMAKAGEWNNLTVRFPLAHQTFYEQAAKQHSVSAAWVYGISRQESSFAADIRSSANARGLMQVLPSTAKEMAKKIGVTFDRSRLRDPEYNIPLGAAYLSQGIEDLSGNMIYATAGYNAGIHRSRTWLKDDKDKLPLDVWAEIIPFSETRKYVKNVMDFSVIYADKLGIQTPLEKMSSQLFVGPN